jgi:phosphatidylglycerophosphate synthase
MRAGVKELVLFWPADVDAAIWARCARSPSLRGLKTLKIESCPFDPRPFDPEKSSSWATICTALEGKFLWLPWNFVTASRSLLALEPSPILPLRWGKPVRLTKQLLGRIPRARATTDPGIDGVLVNSREDVPDAERFLVRNSGKVTDGMYSTFNRKLSRPIVRALTHTRVTPNLVTLAGLFVAIVSSLIYSRGSYLCYVVGAILFFFSGLIDEMDGMLARLKFSESAFGTWFEGFVDNATYLLLFSGITAGLYRQYGKAELTWGIVLIAGCALSVVAVAMQRSVLTRPNRPHEYSARMNQLMETDSNLISRIARQIHIFIKKGVAVHYILIFTVLGGLSLFLRIAAISANLTWTIVFYFTWRFTRTNRAGSVQSAT